MKTITHVVVGNGQGRQMKLSPKTFTVLWVFLILPGRTALADTVTLKDGTIIVGSVTSVTGGFVKLAEKSKAFKSNNEWPHGCFPFFDGDMVCNYDDIKKLELDIGTMRSLFSWDAIERELSDHRFTGMRTTIAGDWSYRPPATTLSGIDDVMHYKFNSDGTYSFDMIAKFGKLRFAIDGRGKYRMIDTGIELRDTSVNSNGSPGTLSTSTANYDRANDTLTLAGVVYRRGSPNSPGSSGSAAVDATAGVQNQQQQRPSTSATMPLNNAVTGVWFRETADISTFERLTITIRADWTYTKESLLRMSIYGGGYIPGKHDGTWRADGMVVSLSGDGNYPGSTHDLRTFTRLR